MVLVFIYIFILVFYLDVDRHASPSAVADSTEPDRLWTNAFKKTFIWTPPLEETVLVHVMLTQGFTLPPFLLSVNTQPLPQRKVQCPVSLHSWLPAHFPVSPDTFLWSNAEFSLFLQVNPARIWKVTFPQDNKWSFVFLCSFTCCMWTALVFRHQCCCTSVMWPFIVSSDNFKAGWFVVCSVIRLIEIQPSHNEKFSISFLQLSYIVLHWKTDVCVEATGCRSLEKEDRNTLEIVLHI